jgi:hypothetical protein
MGDKPRGRGRPPKRGSTAIAVTTSKSSKPPLPHELTKTQKKAFLQQRVYALQQLDYDSIIARFGPVLAITKAGGTLRQAAYAGGMSTEELQILIEWGRCGGSEAWNNFYEEFFRAKSASELEVMQDLKNCSKMGEKWAIERLMNIGSPQEFGAFDVGSALPPTVGNTGITQHFHVTEKFTPVDVVDAEVVVDEPS